MSEGASVSGIGLVTPLGSSVDGVWDALIAGRSAVAQITAFDPGPGAPCQAAVVGEVPARDVLPTPLLRRMDRLSKMIVTAGALAVRDARLAIDPARLAIVVGSALGNMRESVQFLDRLFDKGPSLANPMLFPNLVMNAAASQMAIALTARGPNLTVCEGEVSGEGALEVALGLLRRRRADAVVVAAGDELAPVVFRVLKDARYLSPRRQHREWSSPFDAGATGPVAGEGAAAIVLQPRDGAVRRSYATVASVTRSWVPAPSPHLWARAAEPLALEQVPDVVISGADSSPERDRLELSLLSRAGGATPVYSPKGAIGEHGSSGLTNVAVAALALDRGVLPPLAQLESPSSAEVVLPRAPLAGAWRRALVLGTARGGVVATVVLERPQP